MTARSLALLALAGAIACTYHPPSPGDGGTGGPVGPEPTPQQDETAAQWHCAKRLEAFPELADEEWCTMTPIDPKSAHKPYFGNTQGTISLDPQDGIADNAAHPVYQVVEAGPNFIPEPGGELGDVYRWTAHEHPSAQDLGSGLVSNFGFWAGGIPNLRGGIRPPIIHASFLDVSEGLEVPTIFGHPGISGRYNVSGVPCSDAPLEDAETYWGYGVDEKAWPALLGGHSNGHDSPECAAYVQYHGTHPVLPAYPQTNSEEYNAIERAECMSNNGYAEFSDALLHAAPQNNGMIWVNWDSETVEEIKQWLFANLGDFGGFAAELQVFLDAWELAGGDSPYWPTDPPYRYNHFTYTGVCGHVPALGIYSGESIRTAAGCPSTMMAQFDDLSLEDMDKMIEGELVEGRCVFPYIIDQAPPGAAYPSPLPEWSTGAQGHGKDGDLFLDVSQLDKRTLELWAGSLELRTVEARGELGIEVRPTNELGRQLFEAWRIPPGAVLTSVGQAVVAPPTLDEAGELVEPGVGAFDLLAEAQAVLERGEIIPVRFIGPDGSMLHRYVSPFIG